MKEKRVVFFLIIRRCLDIFCNKENMLKEKRKEDEQKELPTIIGGYTLFDML